ncbi:RNA polymerase sigma factor [Solicola gregarius]|uniref:Sigma-70 family RNA polymerase sigma factor n=1 Tax=Solicola gregarius TaxID=2908642 RepID=A0AA46THT1_9ACTN|nr:sigma-70 family RNA polymerase sigma factor [Solicola gregarius]UYM05072.1 sigma-70 family RNA polymerase sigma factor [Solicola gregarius]
MAAPSSQTSEARWQIVAGLFTRWCDGDRAALDELVRTSTPALWHLVRAYGLDRHSAEDVVQTTWMALVRNRDRIEDAQAVTAWLATTARREAWRVAKDASRQTVTDEETVADALPAGVPVDEQVQVADESRRLWNTVRRLSHRCQRLLRVIAFEDRPDYRRLASELEMPVGSIGPTRGRCLDKLRVLLDEEAGV